MIRKTHHARVFLGRVDTFRVKIRFTAKQERHNDYERRQKHGSSNHGRNSGSYRKAWFTPCSILACCESNIRAQREIGIY